MYDSSQRNIGKEQAVSNFRGNSYSRIDNLTHLQSVWRYDVAFFTIDIKNKCNTCTTVWIVLDTVYSTRNTIFVPLKVNNTITLFVSTTYISHCHMSDVISTAGFLYRT